MLPDYVNLSYDFIIWTSYIEQMNAIVEKVVYSDGAYWGDPDKLIFRIRMNNIWYNFSGKGIKKQKLNFRVCKCNPMEFINDMP